MENFVKNNKSFTEEDIENFKRVIELAESDDKLFQDLRTHGAPIEIAPKLSMYYAGMYVANK